MNTFIKHLSVAVAIMSCIAGCKTSAGRMKNRPGEARSVRTSNVDVRTNVLTAADQKAMTPDWVINSLKEGNRRFVTNRLTPKNDSAMVRMAASGQYPEAVVLSCLDSRIPVEDVFDRGIGDLFVTRVAGNVVNEDILGSMEFGCKVSGAHVIVVMGHEGCGAVKAAIDNVQLGNITALVSKIQPAVAASDNFVGEKSSKNDSYLEVVAKNNILHTIEMIKENSPLLKEQAAKGEITIVGAYYNLKTGEVSFL